MGEGPEGAEISAPAGPQEVPGDTGGGDGQVASGMETPSDVMPTADAANTDAVNTAPRMPDTLSLLWRRAALVEHARRMAPSTWAVIAISAVALVMRLWPLGGGSTDYDEGVYWQSLRAMAAGHPQYSAVFASQPPFFLAGVYPFYLLFGQSLAAARLGIVVYSLVGLAAMYVAGRALAGRWIGVLALALLAADPTYLRASSTLQAEVPALALAIAAVALAILVPRAVGRRRAALAVAAGFALGLGVGAKLFDVVAVVPVALYLLAPVGLVLVDDAGRPRRPERAAVVVSLRAAVPDLLGAGSGLVLALAVVFLPFVGSWPALYDQVVRFHLEAGRVANAGLGANLRLIADSGEMPFLVVAALLAAVALARRAWRVLPPALWALASLVLLARQQPLFGHHLTLLAPALTLTSALAVTALLDLAPAVVWRTRSTAGNSALPDGTPITIAPARVGAVLVGALILFGAVVSFGDTRAAAVPSYHELAIAAAVAQATQPGDLVVSDDQYAAALAGRDVPPSLVDTSDVRIASGYLTAAELETTIQSANVRAVLFVSGRFDRIPGFRQWVRAHYLLVGTFGQDTALYLKLPPAPAVV